MPASTVNALLAFLHNLFTAAWVGGMIAMAIAVAPAIRAVAGQGQKGQDLQKAIFRRLSVVAKLSILGLVATGVLIARRSAKWEGLFNLSDAYHIVLSIKHALVIAMIAIAAARASMLSRRGVTLSRHAARVANTLLIINAALGVAVLALGSYAGVLDTACTL